MNRVDAIGTLGNKYSPTRRDRIGAGIAAHGRLALGLRLRDDSLGRPERKRLSIGLS